MGMVHDICYPPLLSKNTNKSWLWACADMEDFTPVIAMFLENILINHCKDTPFSDKPLYFCLIGGNIMNHSGFFSAFRGFRGGLFYRRSGKMVKQMDMMFFFFLRLFHGICGAGSFRLCHVVLQ